MAYWANIVTFRIYTRALGAVVNYHAVENLPMNGSVCVANHTTILDVVTLSNHRPYALIGQAHGGALGWWQKRLARCTKVEFQLERDLMILLAHLVRENGTTRPTSSDEQASRALRRS